MNDFVTAIVLFAHGSRDPLWRAPIDAVAASIRQQDTRMAVSCAFLELMTPDLDTAIEALVQQGHRSIRIVPLFLGMGRHVRQDLPALLAHQRRLHPEILLDCQCAIGEQEEMIHFIAQLALGAPSLNTT